MSSKKGDRWERHYRNALDADDAEDDRADYERVGVDDVEFVRHFTAVRMPASGGGSKQDLPDLHIWLRTGDEVDQFAGEVKAGNGSVRLTNEEIDALVRFARATGATPLVFVHIDHDHAHDPLGGDYVVPVSELHSTEKGYTFTKARDAEDALTFAEWAKRPTTSI